ncbi:MAG: hypothetical protein HKN76_15725 [Saprospiraceae bacterium]|nr:hypothetical protein [Saprospiraceae bacterium]
MQTFSDLNFNVTVEQTSKMAGAELGLYATLQQYKLPLDGRVYADISSPDGDIRTVELKSSKKGFFSGKFKSTSSGLYHLRLRAMGMSLTGKRFTRETIRTVSLYRENPIIHTEDSPKSEMNLSAIIDCLLAQKGVIEYLRERGIDLNDFPKCLKASGMRPIREQSSSKKKRRDFNQTERQMLDRFQSFLTTKKDVDLINSVPKMRKVDFPTPDIPTHSKKALSMPVSPGVRLNEKGKLEIVKFKHKSDAKGKKPTEK